jgi:hypothetical protein
MVAVRAEPDEETVGVPNVTHWEFGKAATDVAEENAPPPKEPNEATITVTLLFVPGSLLTTTVSTAPGWIVNKPVEIMLAPEPEVTLPVTSTVVAAYQIMRMETSCGEATNVPSHSSWRQLSSQCPNRPSYATETAHKRRTT